MTMTHDRVFTLFCALAIVGCVGHTVDAASTTWTASAERAPAIEVAPPVSTPMGFAAAELARYLGQILGKPVAVGPAGEGQPRIVVEKVPDSSPMGDESYEIAADGAALRLRGGGDLGVVFGAYEFLRRYGGCRFSGLGPDGELVPRRSSITAEGLPLRRKPKLWYRGPQMSSRPPGDRLTEEEFTELSVQWVDWLTKNGFNYVMCGAYSLVTGSTSGEWFLTHIRPEMLKRGLKFDANHHSLSGWLPAGRHFAQHPEWFPMVDGQRVKRTEQFSFCTSNPDAVRTLIENVKTFLRKHPEMSIVGVIPDDGYGLCHCEACTRLDEANGLDPKEQYQKVSFVPGNRAKIRRYTLLINEVAQAVREGFPDRLLGYGAYVDVTCPDPQIAIEPNVVPWVTMYWCDGARPIEPDSPSKINREYYEALKQWRQRHRGKLITYSYYMGMNAQRSLPYPQDRVIVQEWKHLKALGIDGATIQEKADSHEIYALNMLALARSAWEDEVNPDALLDEYLEGMYGSVAGQVKPIFDAFHEVWRRAAEDAGAGRWPEFSSNSQNGRAISPNGQSIVLLIEGLGAERLDECLRRAQEKAANDRERRQVAKLTQAAQYWKAAAAYWRLDRQASEATPKGDKAAAAALKAQAVRKAQEAMEHFNRLPPGWARGRYTAQRGFPK